MEFKLDQDSISHEDPDNPNYLQLALRALSELANDESQELDNTQLLNAFCHAFTMDDSTHRDEILSYLRKAGLTDDDIIDKIIPTAARKIGEQWVRDELTFAQVTISASRMQELSRFLGGRNERVPSTIPLGFNALLIIPKEEQHTMGAFVAADQFRRQGLWVHMAIGQDAKELERTVTHNHFSMIGISAAARRSLKSVKTIVDILKDKDTSIPVILGGNIINIVDDIQSKTNVDLVSSSPREAVTFCGLPTPQRVLSDLSKEI